MKDSNWLLFGLGALVVFMLYREGRNDMVSGTTGSSNTGNPNGGNTNAAPASLFDSLVNDLTAVIRGGQQIAKTFSERN